MALHGGKAHSLEKIREGSNTNNEKVMLKTIQDIMHCSPLPEAKKKKYAFGPSH